MDLHEASDSLSQKTMLEALRAEGNQPRRVDPYTDWKRIYAFAVELADTAVDIRDWVDRHLDDCGRLRYEEHQAVQWSVVSWQRAELLDDDLFIEEGAPLGPLASLQVYSSGFDAWDVPDDDEQLWVWSGSGGKAHAPMRCQHHRESISAKYGDGLLTYGEFIPKLARYRSFRENRSRYYRAPICSKCGGVTIRLLSDEQLSHLKEVREAVISATDEARSGGYAESHG